MSQAEDLLNSLTEDEVATYASLDPTTEPHIVINPDRTVTVPESLLHIAVERDHNIETVTFDCPRYWDGHDLSQMKLRIIFQRPDGHREPHLAENVRVDPDDANVIHFDWTLSSNVTLVRGNISFTVCAKLTNAEGVSEREWHTRLNQDLIVDEGMDCSGEEIVEQNPDILESILVRLDALESSSGTGSNPGSSSSGSGQNVNQYAFLNGLKYYALGDSITEIQGTTADPKLFGNWYTTDLQGRDLREITVSGYVQAIESRYGLTATNYGKSGHTLVGDFSTLVTKDYSDVALVTIAYGVNDARTGVPLGTVNSTDTATFAGALNQLLRKIYTDNPECRVLVLAPLQRLYVSEFGIATPNANGNYLIDFVNMCRAIAEKRSTAFLDQYRHAGINQTNLYYYTVEGVHPVNQGFNRIKNAVVGILDELFAVEYEPFGVMTNTGDAEPDEPEIDNGGGTETPPTEDTTGGSIDLTGLFVLDKVIYDAYVADGKRIEESGYNANSGVVCTEATELPVGRVYTITTYLGHDGVYAGYVHTTPERQKWDEDQGKYVPNSIGATISTGTATVEEVTIDGTVYRKLTYSADASKATKYAWIGCKRGMEDRVTVTYV